MSISGPQVVYELVDVGVVVRYFSSWHRGRSHHN